MDHYSREPSLFCGSLPRKRPTSEQLVGQLADPPEPEPTEEGVLKILTQAGWRSLEGPPGSPGIVEPMKQTDEPETSTIGAIWIRQEPL